MSWIARLVLFISLLLFPAGALAQARAGVEVGQLSQIESFSISALPQNQAGLSATQWLNSDVLVLQELMAGIPVQPGSRSLRNLLVRSLLSGGQAPGSGKDLEELAALRLGAIYSLGQIDAAIKIAERSPGGHKKPETAAIAANALLLTGDVQTVCSIANKLTEAREAVFWLQIRSYCLAQANNVAGAELMAELALAAEPNNTDFLKQINRITTPTDETFTIAPATALELAMARSAGDEIDVQDLPIALQVSVGRQQSPNSINILFEAFIAGVITPQEIAVRLLSHASSLNTLEQTPIENEAAAEQLLSDFELEVERLKRAKSHSGIDRIASLLAVGRNSHDPKIRAEALVLLLNADMEFEQWLALHQLIEMESQQLTPNPSLKQYAAVLAQSSLLAGNASRAKQWLSVLESDERSMILIDLPLIAMDRRFPLRQQALQEKMYGSELQQSLLISDLLALQALHRQLPPRIRQWIADRPETNEPACRNYKLSALAASAKAGAVAETILRAANIMGTAGFDARTDHCNAAIVSALWQAGLRREAQLAAVEWMFARRQVR